MSNEKGRKIVEIKKLILQKFTESDWLEIAIILNVQDVINGHQRLLRSLGFGDDDYEHCVLQVLSEIAERGTNNLEEIEGYISQKYADTQVSDFISTAHTDMPRKMISFSPQVFSVPTKEQNKKLVAVMFPFSQKVAFEAIKSICTELGLDCKKADDIWDNSTFIQDIFELIFTCEIVIADFTGKNPNVFYEVGIAHTLGKTVIPVTQSIDDVPSDLRHHRVLKYLPNSQGYDDMKVELKKRLLVLVPPVVNKSDSLPF